MSRIAPFWSLADLVSASANPEAFQVSLEDMMSDTGRLVDDKFSQYDAKGTPFLEGDVLFGKLRPYLAKYWLADRPGTSGGDIHVYRPAPDVEPRFLRYIIGSRDFVKYAEAASKGVKMPRVEWMNLREFGVYRPDRSEQQRIADYLDRETAEIDAMIATMDELAEMLETRKRVTASYVWTLGFRLIKLKWLVNEIDDRAGSAGDLPLLSVSIHYGVQLRSESTSKQRASEDLSSYKVVRAGEIVLNRMRAFQGGLGMATRNGIVSPDYSVVRTNTGLQASWAEKVMRTPEFIASMTQRLRGIGGAEVSSARTPRINFRDLVELEIPLPTAEEQQRITDHLDEVTARINAMLAKVAELKSLLTERRAAIITDAVTGRKGVA